MRLDLHVSLANAQIALFTLHIFSHGEFGVRSSELGNGE